MDFGILSSNMRVLSLSTNFEFWSTIFGGCALDALLVLHSTRDGKNDVQTAEDEVNITCDDP